MAPWRRWLPFATAVITTALAVMVNVATENVSWWWAWILVITLTIVSGLLASNMAVGRDKLHRAVIGTSEKATTDPSAPSRLRRFDRWPAPTADALGIAIVVVVLSPFVFIALSAIFDGPADSTDPYSPTSRERIKPEPERPLRIDDVTASLYSPGGSGSSDGVTKVDRVVDGNQTTVWSSDDYQQQFPLSKQYLAIHLSFNGSYRPSRLAVLSDTPGTSFSIYPGFTAAPPPIGDTGALGSGLVTVNQAQIVVDQNRLPQAGVDSLWLRINKLGSDKSGPPFRSQIKEIEIDVS